jgi:hypothetical protein
MTDERFLGYCEIHCRIVEALGDKFDYSELMSGDDARISKKGERYDNQTRRW